MPAIRYRYNNVCANVLTHLPQERKGVGVNMVEIRTAAGGFERVDWCGFVCTHALPFMGDGRFCKIICAAVTDGGAVSSRWRDVARSDYALGWMLPGKAKWPNVYGIVGRDGFPIVVHADGTFSDSGIRDYVRAARSRRVKQNAVGG